VAIVLLSGSLTSQFTSLSVVVPDEEVLTALTPAMGLWDSHVRGRRNEQGTQKVGVEGEVVQDGVLAPCLLCQATCSKWQHRLMSFHIRAPHGVGQSNTFTIAVLVR
jgi:hypothetical protein